MLGWTARHHVSLGLSLLAIASCGPDGSASRNVDPSEVARLRFAHLAPQGASVDVVVLDEGAFLGLEFAEITEYGNIRPGVHLIDVVEEDDTERVLATATAELEASRVYTLVAYRDLSRDTAMQVMLFEEKSAQKPEENGLITVGNGADDIAWSTVNVVESDTRTTLVEGLEFGTQSQAAEVPATEIGFGFDTAPPSPEVDTGPFVVEICRGQHLLVFAVDEAVEQGVVDVSVYLIDADTAGGSIATLSTAGRPSCLSVESSSM